MPNITSIRRFDDIEDTVTQAESRQSIFNDNFFRELFFRKIDSMISPKNAVLSLDVFDTLLLRDNSAELTRFIEIGHYMAQLVDGHPAPKCSQHKVKLGKRSIDAFIARYMGTHSTYRARDRNRGYGEGSLTEIHTVTSRLLTGKDDSRDAFIEIELCYEAMRISPNYLLLDYAKYNKNRGGKNILLSDMYMHSAQIEHLLSKSGVDLSLFEIISSSADTRVSKASGLIFRDIEEKMGLPASHFLHIGDSLRGDFQQPKKNGWQAVHLPISDNEIKLRRKDHFRSLSTLKEEFSIEVEVAAPH